MQALPIVLLVGFLTAGCSSLKGTMFDGRACTFATDADAQKDVKDIVETFVTEKDRQEAALAMKLVKLSATAACEQKRAVDAEHVAK